MELTDILNNSNNLINKRVDYIFTAFKKEFSNVCYDERSSIIGISEPNKHLMCYFRFGENGEVLVKFKNSTPVSLLDKIENIDLLIKKTIDLFKTNDYLVVTKRSRARLIYNSKRGVKVKEFDKLIEEIATERGEIPLRDVASKKLIETLYSVGMRTIADLKGWTYASLMKVNNFGEVRLRELNGILYALKEEKLPEIFGDSDLKYLYRRASSGMVKKFAEKENIQKYLSSISYNANQFNEDTLGRVLCLRKNVQPETSLCFCVDGYKLYQAYLDNVDKYSSLLESTKKLLSEIIIKVIPDERNKDILLSLLCVEGENYTFENLGEKHNLSKERIRQILNRELLRLSYGFNLFSESGVLLFILRQNYFKSFNNCPIDAFILYLHTIKQERILTALFRVILKGVSTPEKLKSNVKTALTLLQGKSEKSLERVEADSIKYKGFQVVVSDDGEVLTDLELLEKLRAKRLELSNKMNMPAFCVYNNKQLVTLATFKPLNKKMYVSLRGFTEKTWEQSGSVMVEIIKEYIDYSAQPKIQPVGDVEDETTYCIKTLTADSMVGESWTEEEESRLVEEFKQGLKVREIAKLHYRKNGGIRARLKKLKLLK